MGAGSSAQAAPAKPSSAMQETRVEVPAEAPQGGAPATWTEEESVCVICLDSNNTAADPLLSGLCACTSSAIHHSCLEKLINSGRRRVMPLEERVSCPVCTRGYDVPHTFYVLRPRSPAYHPSHPTGSQLLFRTLCTVFLAFLTVGYLARFIFPVLTDSAFFIVVAVLSLVCLMHFLRRDCHLPSWCTCRRGLPANPHALDDEQFHRRVVAKTRNRSFAPGPGDLTLGMINSGRIVVHVGRANVRKPIWRPSTPHPLGANASSGIGVTASRSSSNSSGVSTPRAVMEASTSFAPPAAQRIVSV
mmetsp:Transcript_18709/g.50273  ORF Transcript_18709/g.50273 Transcript_18709/m.50273 type:complete len:303 (-) Transcript_18709:250-1158(-)